MRVDPNWRGASFRHPGTVADAFPKAVLGEERSGPVSPTTAISSVLTVRTEGWGDVYQGALVPKPVSRFLAVPALGLLSTDYAKNQCKNQCPILEYTKRSRTRIFGTNTGRLSQLARLQSKRKENR